jgi:hypothetical protein
VNVGGFLYYRNQKARAQWMYRWAQQGGSFFYRARSLQDTRNASQKFNGHQLRMAAGKVRKYAKALYEAAREKRATERETPQVVNLAAVRIERARRRSATR